MQLFYTNNINSQLATLEAEEARHLQVLRKKAGDQIHLVDGKGFFHLAELFELSKKEAQLKILSSEQQPIAPFSLHIAIAPTKNIARLEWFLEKATEIGIQEITPIYCEHSERKRIRLDRLEKIVLSAMKQSNRAYLPQLYEETTFKQFMQMKKESQELKYIAHCEEEEKVELYNNYQAGKDVLVLIGPEGDFSRSEIELAKNTGFTGVSLGKARLRTETAGIVACHTIQLLNGCETSKGCTSLERSEVASKKS